MPSQFLFAFIFRANENSKPEMFFGMLRLFVLSSYKNISSGKFSQFSNSLGGFLNILGTLYQFDRTDLNLVSLYVGKLEKTKSDTKTF